MEEWNGFAAGEEGSKAPAFCAPAARCALHSLPPVARSSAYIGGIRAERGPFQSHPTLGRTSVDPRLPTANAQDSRPSDFRPKSYERRPDPEEASLPRLPMAFTLGS